MMVKRTFEIEWNDDHGPLWMNTSNLLICLTETCRNSVFTVRDVTGDGNSYSETAGPKGPDDPQEMKVFAITGFPGFWPVGTSAVVIARTEGEAFFLLNLHLKDMKIGPAVAGECNIVELSTDKPHVQILCDGDY